MFFIDLTLEKNPLERCKKVLSNLSSRFKKKIYNHVFSRSYQNECTWYNIQSNRTCNHLFEQLFH